MPDPSILRGYRWNANAQRYVSAATGRFVARTRIVDLLERSVSGRERRLVAGLQAFADGDIAPSTFLARSRTLLKRQYLQNASLGAGGWDQLTARESGRIGGNLRWEMERMRNMAQELQDGKISIAQANNRMRMYMGNARREFYRTEREHLAYPEAGKTWMERRRLGVAEHCDDCIGYADMGWQSLGVLPVPGDGSSCDGNCRCEMLRREVSIEQVYELAEGGPGSGHAGHLGRPGHVGGSMPGMGGSGAGEGMAHPGSMAGRENEQPVTIKALNEDEKGASLSWVLTYEDGTQALFKLAQDESGVGNADNEVAAYELAQVLGYDGVPETIYASVKLPRYGFLSHQQAGVKEGSAQLWIANSLSGREVEHDVLNNKSFQVQYAKMKAFDAVIGNDDRHRGNWIVDESGKLWAIDHGLAFFKGNRPRVQGLDYTQKPTAIQTLGDWSRTSPEILGQAAAKTGMDGDLLLRRINQALDSV